MATSLPDKSERAKPKFLDQVRTILRTRHCSLRTGEAYLGWIRRFILFDSFASRSLSLSAYPSMSYLPQLLHSWQTPPAEMSGDRGGGVPELPGGGTRGHRGHPEPGSQRAAVYTHVLNKPGIGVKSPLD